MMEEAPEGEEQVSEELAAQSLATQLSRIRSSITVHDLTQVQTIFDYSLSSTAGNKSNGFKQVFRKKSFQVEAYIFLPQQVGINTNEYLRSHFYRDLRPLLRFREPRFRYKDFIGSAKQESWSPMVAVMALCAKLATGEQVSEGQLTTAINETRISAVSFSSYLIKRINRRCRQLERLPLTHAGLDGDELNKKLGKILGRIDPLLRRIAFLRRRWCDALGRLERMESQAPALGQLREEMRLADEYCHYRIYDGLTRLGFSLHQASKGDSSLPVVRAYTQRSLVWLRWLRFIAAKRAYSWIGEEVDAKAQEQYVFRKNMLKKRMWQVFYLSMKPRSTLALQKQVAYMAAAGFAAAWAFAANIMIWQKVQEHHATSVYEWQNLINFSGLFLALGVIAAYVFQDRIKEWGRVKFRRGLFGNLPDLSEKIWARTLSDEPVAIGVIHESVDFLKEKNLPEDICSVRSKLPAIDMTGNEKIICYRKVVSFAAGAFDKLALPHPVVRDIVRFNISRFLPKLDDPVQTTLCFRRDGQVTKVQIPKIYHLDMILRYSSQNIGEQMEDITINYNRLAFNKNGLIRVEAQEESDYKRKKIVNEFFSYLDNW